MALKDFLDVLKSDWLPKLAEPQPSKPLGQMNRGISVSCGNQYFTGRYHNIISFSTMIFHILGQVSWNFSQKKPPIHLICGIRFYSHKNICKIFHDLTINPRLIHPKYFNMIII